MTCQPRRQAKNSRPFSSDPNVVIAEGPRRQKTGRKNKDASHRTIPTIGKPTRFVALADFTDHQPH